jgi:C2H2 transcription facotor
MPTINSLVEQVPQPEVDTPTTPKAGQFPHSTSSEQTTAATQSTEEESISHLGGPDDRPSHEARAGPADHKDDQDDAMDLDDPHDDKDSDGDEEGGDEESGSRKKKGQRFFCTGFPPCNLSFTRSEHLARHIRKHTGERPFQCHCNRRFSRLDNLRQHAQTVHVNEEIPAESLAATGTRFQRQVRTERVRQVPRPRSGTMGSTGAHSRGHSRNLSASSIGSTSSNYSTVTEAKRRPPPLLMASDASRPKLGLEAPRTPPPNGHHIMPGSPGGLSTPTSATFSAAPGSPGYPPSFVSPGSSHSRTSSFDSHRRRLSVPSGPNPYQNAYAGPYGGPPSTNPSGYSSVYASPTSSTFGSSAHGYYPPGEDPRRRTWHPSTYNGASYNYGRPATSGLLYSQTPDAPQPAFSQHATAAAAQAPRLPGIETLYDAQDRRDRGLSPPRRLPSPVRSEYPPPPLHRPSEYPPLDDNGQPTARPLSWGQQTIDEIHRVSGPHGYPLKPHDMGPPPQHSQQMAQEALQVSSGKQIKRQAWYTGPIHGARTSPEDSSSSEGIPTPGTSTVEVHPVIMPSSGFIEPQHHMMPPETHQQVSRYSHRSRICANKLQSCLGPAAQGPTTYATQGRERTTSFGERSSNGGDMNRLEALVAVATSGEVAASVAR